jgi:hypothetical protein
MKMHERATAGNCNNMDAHLHQGCCPWGSRHSLGGCLGGCCRGACALTQAGQQQQRVQSKHTLSSRIWQAVCPRPLASGQLETNSTEQHTALNH